MTGVLSVWRLGTKYTRSSLYPFTVILFAKAVVKCTKPCVLHFGMSFQRHLIYTKLVFSPSKRHNKSPSVCQWVHIYL